MALIFDGTNGITFPAGGQGNPTGNVVGTTDTQTVTNKVIDASTLTVNSNAISADNSLGFRNRIINGDMRIDQRNAGASSTPSTNGYPSVDRWFWQNVLSASFTATCQQNAGSVTPPPGFTNYLGLTSGGTFSPATDDMLLWKQLIEGYNFSDLAWGTADAKPITISFWVRSSLTGTFSGAVSGLSGGNSSWVFTYTISAADTWEYKTIYVDGNTTTALSSTTNGTGLQLRFAVSSGSGTTYASSTTGEWVAGNDFGIPNTTNVLGTNGATWYITGVQLEVGSVATPFERRPYGTELLLCQRYFYNLTNCAASAASTTKIEFHYQHPVPMRAAPTLNVVGVMRIEDPSVAAYFQSSATSTLEQATYLGMKPGFGNFTGLTSARPYYVAAAAADVTASPPTGLCQVSAEL